MELGYAKTAIALATDVFTTHHAQVIAVRFTGVVGRLVLWNREVHRLLSIMQQIWIFFEHGEPLPTTHTPRLFFLHQQLADVAHNLARVSHRSKDKFII